MKKLRVIESRNIIVITALNDYNPLQKLNDIAAELSAINFNGKVIFDLLYTNGNSNNRFVGLSFDGHKFDRTSFSVIYDIDDIINQEQNDLFCKHPSLLKESVLSSSDISLFN